MKHHSKFTMLLVIALFSLTGCAIVEESVGIVKESYDNAVERISLKGLNDTQPKFKWKKVPDSSQDTLSDWENEVKRVKKVTLEEAKAIAEADDNIRYFFFVRPGSKTGVYGKRLRETFWAGDAVFFSGEPGFLEYSNYSKTRGPSDIYEKEYVEKP